MKNYSNRNARATAHGLSARYFAVPQGTIGLASGEGPCRSVPRI
jgi:hypothetical protein